MGNGIIGVGIAQAHELGRGPLLHCGTSLMDRGSIIERGQMDIEIFYFFSNILTHN